MNAPLPLYAVLIDFGSTYTKVAVANLQEKKLVHTDHFPSTVATDARIGLTQCFDSACAAIGLDAFTAALKLSSSSAAGGLRMGVVGLSPSLSIAAGRNAAFGAGAKILHTSTGRMTTADIKELEALPLEIILFCGGYENGNVTVLEHNALLLADMASHAPIIFAGNSKAAPAVRIAFTRRNKEFYIVNNIIPDVGILQAQQVETIIREVFLQRIINMKGLDIVSSMLDRMVMPTPAAVLSAGELLSRGCGSHEGLGDLIIVDVGGATTDIHSYANQSNYEGVKIVGAPESYTKRTVEGDLGMRESSNSLLAEIGVYKMARDLHVSEKAVLIVIDKWMDNHGALAQNELEGKVDHALASGAVGISARRHAGWIEHIHSAGLKEVQHGKNLSQVAHIIGTGGPLVFSQQPQEILSQLLRIKKLEPDTLLPEQAHCYLDKEYIFFAAGLLREIDEEAAFLLMKHSLQAL